MGIIRSIIELLAAVLGCLAAALSIPLFLRLRWPAAVMWILKLFVSALSPVFLIIGLFSLSVGLVTGSVFIDLIGIYVVLIFYVHISKVTRPPDNSSDFEQAFGPHWESRINPGQKAHFLPNRRIVRLRAVPDPRLEQNILFSTIPGTGRQLLCDIWQPAGNIAPSGLSFIYLHGSAFYLLDKDFGTRPFFRH
jgi:hypothetical protein